MYGLKCNKIYEFRWITVSEHSQMYFWERITVEEIQKFFCNIPLCRCIIIMSWPLLVSGRLVCNVCIAYNYAEFIHKKYVLNVFFFL